MKWVSRGTVRASFSRLCCLRSRLMMLVLAACVLLFGYVGILLFQDAIRAYREYARESAAARRIEALGGDVTWVHGTVAFVDMRTKSFPNDMAEALAPLSNLQSVSQWLDTPSDSAIARLKNLRRLPGIRLGGPGTTDATIVSLKKVKNLSCLELAVARITDSGLAHLAEFESLTTLKLNRVAISDAGLVHLKVLRNLKALDLSETAVTDAGLVQLRDMHNLETLRLYLCPGITRKGVNSLRRTLPNTSIGWDKEAILGDWQ
jgi:hypothetical protein